jgi:hypothetical protein
MGKSEGNSMATVERARKTKSDGSEGEARKAARVQLRMPVVRVIIVPIKGYDGVPLVMNKMSEKAVRMMANKQQKKGVGPREAKNPVECFRGAMHLMPGAKATDQRPDLGFPCSGFRKAMITAANKDMNGVTKTAAKGGIFVLADGYGLVRIRYEKMQMREDPVMNANETPDLRYRPELYGWSADVRVQYDADMLTPEQVVNVMGRAGFSVGIGEGRPEKKGEWGRWSVVLNEKQE